MKKVRCFLLPEDCPPQVGPNVVVIDVLRASTTICASIANGATCVKPFLEFEQAQQWAQAENVNELVVLTGGERGGEKLPGFDLGNSPLEYAPARVAGKKIAFSTTNGTRAMEKCRAADQVVIGAFCNLSAVARYFQIEDELDIVCAGTDRQFSVEDSAFAGALIERFCLNHEYSLDEGGDKCLKLWQESKDNLLATLRAGLGGMNLIRLGRDQDIEFAATLDSYSLVPKLDIPEWKIEPA